MIKYLLVAFTGYDDYVNANVVNSFDDIKIAEKARIGYLQVYPKVDPQNVQVLNFKYESVDEIPF